MKKWNFCVSCFENSFTIFVFDAAVWTGGTASMSFVYSLPGLIATFTGVMPSITLVSTPENIITKSTFFCLSYPDQSCTNHKGQANCENFHDFFSRYECSKFRILSPEKITQLTILYVERKCFIYELQRLREF